MNKWGVRLISCYFFIWAISNVLKLIFSPSRADGLFGIHFYLPSYNGSPQIEILGWFAAYILLYTGIQLLRFDKRGRTWALIMLWPYTITSGTLFIAALISFFSSPVRKHLTSSINCNFGVGSCKPETSLALSALLGWGFVYCLTPLYFLLRKNTKEIFIKPTVPQETDNTPPLDSEASSS
jgi:hypothetical protein